MHRVVRLPLPLQVRVPSIESEPPAIGIEDEDPGVRLEVRLEGHDDWLSVFVVLGSPLFVPDSFYSLELVCRMEHKAVRSIDSLYAVACGSRFPNIPCRWCEVIAAPASTSETPRECPLLGNYFEFSRVTRTS